MYWELLRLGLFYLLILSNASVRSMRKTALKMSIANKKIISVVRHGRTEMNDVLSQHSWGDPNFNDAELWDTRLTEIGQKQARSLNLSVRSPDSRHAHLLHADLLVASPLSRALHTAELLFKDTKFFPSSSGVRGSAPKKMVTPLASERVYLSSDTGRHHSELSNEFPLWDYSLLQPQHRWWYHDPAFEPRRTKKGEVVNGYVEWRPDGYYAVAGEPTEVFRARMRALRQWLETRPESRIVLVCHWAVARALTGESLANCEVKTLEMSEILQDPLIDDD